MAGWVSRLPAKVKSNTARLEAMKTLAECIKIVGVLGPSCAYIHSEKTQGLAIQYSNVM